LAGEDIAKHGAALWVCAELAELRHVIGLQGIERTREMQKAVWMRERALLKLSDCQRSGGAEDFILREATGGCGGGWEI